MAFFLLIRLHFTQQRYFASLLFVDQNEASQCLDKDFLQIPFFSVDFEVTSWHTVMRHFAFVEVYYVSHLFVVESEQIQRVVLYKKVVTWGNRL